MDQRSTALAVAGIVAALLVVVALVLEATGGDLPAPTEPGTTTPTTTISPSAVESSVPRPGREQTRRFTAATYDGWLTSIPDTLPVAAGLPEDGGDVDRSTRPVRARLCGTEAFPAGAEIDTSRAAAGGPEYGDARDLRLFDDDRAAHGLLARVARTAAGCREEEHGGTTWLHDARPVDLGEEALLVVETYEVDGLPAPGANIWHVVRVGNAVLVTTASGEYLPGETLGPGIRDHQGRVAPVVGAMCVFAVEGC